MSEITLFQDATHKNILLPDASGEGLAVQANHHVVVHNEHAMLLDPGGHKVFNKIFPDLMSRLKGGIQYLFLSHQDPDIVAATNGWLMVTDATAYVSTLWMRFVPHFGIDKLVEERLRPIPDEGMWLEMNGCSLCFLPAHFLHSAGNFQVYDPHSKILYTGDLGSSLGFEGREVLDFDAHLQHMEGFHRRYMTNKTILKAWVKMVRDLDIEIIAPQHGAFFRGKPMVKRFIDWCDDLECGTDLYSSKLKIPQRP